MRSAFIPAFALSLLSAVAFSASPTIEESPMSPLGIRTVILGNKDEHQLPLYLEPPSTNEVFRCMKKQGGCLVIIPQTGGTVLRQYCKPKFSKTQFVFEDQPLSSNSQAEEAWQGYQWLRDMLLSAKCFEIDYGVEITELAGDKYQALTNAVKSLARTYNGERIDNKKQYESDFDDIKMMVREKSVAEQGRIGLRTVNAFRAVYAQNYTLPDEETKAILEALDAIRTKGSNGSPDAATALATRQKAYADAVLATVRKEREACIGNLAESHVPFELLFTSSETAKNPLVGFPVEIDEKAETAIVSIDERIASAQAELAEGRKRHKSVIERMTTLDESKFGQERVYGTGSRAELLAILNSHKGEEEFLTAKELSEANAILANAEAKQEALTRLDNEAQRWVAIQRERLDIIRKLGNDASLSSSGFDAQLLFPDGVDKIIAVTIDKVSKDTIAHFEKEKNGIEQKITSANALLEKAKSTIHWAEVVKRHLANLTASKYPETDVFRKTKPADISRKLSEIYKAPLKDWSNAMSQINADMKDAQDRFSVLSTIDSLLEQSSLSATLVSEVRNHASNKEIMSELVTRHSNRYIRYLALSLLGTSAELLQDFIKEHAELIIAASAKSESLSLKGFQLGMDIGDAYILCKYHFPDKHVQLAFGDNGTTAYVSVFMQAFAKAIYGTKVSSYSIPPDLLEALLQRITVNAIETELGISLRETTTFFSFEDTKIAAQTVFSCRNSSKGSVSLYGDIETDDWEVRRLRNGLEQAKEKVEDLEHEIKDEEEEKDQAAKDWAMSNGVAEAMSWGALGALAFDMSDIQRLKNEMESIKGRYDRQIASLKRDKDKASAKVTKLEKALADYEEFKRNAKPVGYLILSRGE